MRILLFLGFLFFFLGFPLFPEPSTRTVDEFKSSENAVRVESNVVSKLKDKHKLIFSGKPKKVGAVEDFKFEGEAKLTIINGDEDKPVNIQILKSGREKETMTYAKNNVDNWFENGNTQSGIRPNSAFELDTEKLSNSEMLERSGNAIISISPKYLPKDLNGNPYMNIKVAEGDVVIMLFDDFYDFEYKGTQLISAVSGEDRALFFGNPNMTICPDCID